MFVSTPGTVTMACLYAYDRNNIVLPGACGSVMIDPQASAEQRYKALCLLCTLACVPLAFGVAKRRAGERSFGAQAATLLLASSGIFVAGSYRPNWCRNRPSDIKTVPIQIIAPVSS